MKMKRRDLFRGITGIAGASVAAFAAKKGIGLPEAQPGAVIDKGGHLAVSNAYGVDVSGTVQASGTIPGPEIGDLVYISYRSAWMGEPIEGVYTFVGHGPIGNYGNAAAGSYWQFNAFPRVPFPDGRFADLDLAIEPMGGDFFSVVPLPSHNHSIPLNVAPGIHDGPIEINVGRFWGVDVQPISGPLSTQPIGLSGVHMTTPAYFFAETPVHFFADGLNFRTGLPVTEYDAVAQTVDGTPLMQWNEDGYDLRREVIVTGTENGYYTKRGGRLYLAKRDAGD